jgi:hypothetical protein
MMKKATFVALLFLSSSLALKAQSMESFTDDGGTCSSHIVSHNGGASLNWVCLAPVTGGAVDNAVSVGFSVVLNSDGTFTNGYISFYGQDGNSLFTSVNFTGAFSSSVFSGTFSGATPSGEGFSGDATQILASRTVVNRYGRHTYYSVGAGSGGDVTFANND